MYLSKAFHSSVTHATIAITVTAMLCAWSLSAFAEAIPPNILLGVEASAETVAKNDLSITPDGDNLPAGSGTHAQGAPIYEAKCASCHGPSGTGIAPVDPLVGGVGSLTSEKPVKTVVSFWPYSSTLFDYMRRAMPLNAPLSLTDDEVYALTAYILAEGGIIEKAAVMDATSLPQVQMPNRAGFVSKWPGHTHK